MAVIRKNFRHKLIKNFFSSDELKLLQTYCLNAIKDPSKIESQRTEPSFCPAFYDDWLMNTILDYKKEVVEKACGLKLFKTYTYWRYYGFGSELLKHRDRPACEISITTCINKTDDWPIIVEGKEIEIPIGGALLYLGVEDQHARPGLYQGDGMAQLFMHYVDQHGPFAHHQEDNYLKDTKLKQSPEDTDYIINVLNIHYDGDDFKYEDEKYE